MKGLEDFVDVKQKPGIKKLADTLLNAEQIDLSFSTLSSKNEKATVNLSIHYYLEVAYQSKVRSIGSEQWKICKNDCSMTNIVITWMSAIEKSKAVSMDTKTLKLKTKKCPLKRKELLETINLAFRECVEG